MEDLSAQERQTHDFAAQTTTTVRTVCPTAPDWVAEVSIHKGVWKATIAAPDDKPVVLTVEGRRLLRLKVSYECTTSARHSYMLVETSTFELLPAKGREPLVRIDYLRHPESDVPCGHLHVHAHRDDWTFAMTRNGVGSRRRSVARRASAERAPQLSDVHFPVGGPRLRPTLEDFLEMLIHDIGVDHTDDALVVLARQRQAWRIDQIRAAVASLPEVAADVLRDAGYTVSPAAEKDRPLADPRAWLTRY
ncbi:MULTISPECIES: hypothetical protein [Actinomyces]|uniref:Uncharacterized protein n=1 Tax=Actinomyces respiraculi TaxID=2744574 RepID=A0A7T0LIW5_9ACTO|nr:MULTISPECIES: hypothetical protein [Actinomyces]QPL04589.1 hypothetical protein ID810_07210 [Actinomyces respiraculi]